MCLSENASLEVHGVSLATMYQPEQPARGRPLTAKQAPEDVEEHARGGPATAFRWGSASKSYLQERILEGAGRDSRLDISTSIDGRGSPETAMRPTNRWR